MVCELQLHFHAVHELKPMAHRVYSLKRAVGWDQDGSGAKPTRLMRTKVKAAAETVVEPQAKAAEPRKGPKPSSSKPSSKVQPITLAEGSPSTDGGGGGASAAAAAAAAPKAGSDTGLGVQRTIGIEDATWSGARGRALMAGPSPAESEAPASSLPEGERQSSVVTIIMDMARPYGWNRDGLLVERVLPGKQAAEVGVKAGWRIWAVEGVRVYSDEDLLAEKARIRETMPAGSTLAAVTFETVELTDAAAGTTADLIGGGDDDGLQSLPIQGQIDLLNAQVELKSAELAQLGAAHCTRLAEMRAQHGAVLAEREARNQAQLHQVQEFRSSKPTARRPSLPWRAQPAP